MTNFRKILFQIHLWVGLVAGIFFVALGLSGSALVYPNLLQPNVTAPRAETVATATSTGQALSLEDAIATARRVSTLAKGRAATVTLPRAPGDALAIQFNPRRGGEALGENAGRENSSRENAGRENTRGENRERSRGRSRRGGGEGQNAAQNGRASDQIFLDPVSGEVLAHRLTGQGSIVGIAHQMHEAMLLGGAGRTLVAWLGVGMLFLGLSGLYMWWPKKGQWKFAFGVRRNARGFRLYREIHGAVGIWFWLVFLFVTLTSLPLGFPSLAALVTGQPARSGPPPGFGQPQTVDAPGDAAPLPLGEILARTEKTVGGKALGLTVPAQPDRALSVLIANGDGPPRNITVDPYTGAILSSPAPARGGQLDRRMIEQWHGGEGLGPVWKFLVFLSGFLPLIFVVTGLMMWIKKRQHRSLRPKIA